MFSWKCKSIHGSIEILLTARISDFHHAWCCSEASCLCEGVRFSIHGEPENIFLCCCNHCSKMLEVRLKLWVKHTLCWIYSANRQGKSANTCEGRFILTKALSTLETWMLNDTLSGFQKQKVFCKKCGCTLWTIPLKHGGAHLMFEHLSSRMGIYFSRIT